MKNYKDYFVKYKNNAKKYLQEVLKKDEYKMFKEEGLTISDLVYECPNCGNKQFIKADDESYICCSCEAIYPANRITFCDDCQKVMVDSELPICKDCHKRKTGE